MLVKGATGDAGSQGISHHGIGPFFSKNIPVLLPEELMIWFLKKCFGPMIYYGDIWQ